MWQNFDIVSTQFKALLLISHSEVSGFEILLGNLPIAMSGTGGFALSRTHGGDRFYNPPPIRRHQQLLLQQQQLQHRQEQLQRPVNSDASLEPQTRTDSDHMTLLKPSVCSSPPGPTSLTNLDRLVESVTPFVPAQCFPEANVGRRRSKEPGLQPFFSLSDLWESYREWSVYGVGVPMLLNGSDTVIQYYVPSLSGIQLYIDPAKPSSRVRRPCENSDAESSREMSSSGSTDCDSERQTKSSGDRPNLIGANSLRIGGPSLRDVPPLSLSGDESEVSNSTELLIFEYLEQEQPRHRQPLTDKVSVLASQFPALSMYSSYDLLPSSWISVAWYPIYRIPMGQTLRDLDASFLTFHSLSTLTQSCDPPQFHGSSDREFHRSADGSLKMSLPVFGLASYKFKGPILNPSGHSESQQANTLLQSAKSWLSHLQVDLPDYRFFVSHSNSHRR